ncbi:MAG: secondary thiamine-phosphate synthase enzyme [Ectothiorhodospiraceae bacterium]|nr:secondary thiamine-phosphate synthase enzyme [Ectothiorhodospiraceae bacterium]
MAIVNEFLTLETKGNCDIIDITKRLQLLLSKQKMSAGHALVFVSGSTAALTTIEYEPGLKQDFTEMIDRLVPKSMRYFHEETWNDGNGHSHIRSSLIGPSITIPFGDGEFLLGTWQQVIFVDFDNRPRTRKLVVQFTGE